MIGMSVNMGYLFTDKGVVKISLEQNDLNGRNFVPYTFESLNIALDIINENFINKKNGKILYKTIQSDEGGRFYKSQICYSVFQLFDNYNLKISENYIWISHNQMINLIKNKYFDIEARILFACFNLYNENID
jgi:hypothetical protein